MPDHPYGWLSIAPPLVAVGLAIATRRVLVPLLAGLAIGALITTGGRPVEATVELFEVHLWTAFIQPDKLRLFAFTLAMGAAIGVIHAAGGMQGLVRLIAPRARTRRSGQLVTWGLGMLIFFDDYANSLIIGSTMQPTCDRLRISREKLAYVVDSTAAPVAGIALISTWIAVELDYIREGLGNLDPQVAGQLNPFNLFVACIPYRFYVIQALLFVPLVAWLGRDFGPMLAAERRSAGGKLAGGPSHAAHPTAAEAAAAASDAQPPDLLPNPYDDGRPVEPTHWTNALLPLAVILLLVLWLIYATGAAAVADSPARGLAHVRQAFGNGDSGLALCYGGLGGLVTAAALARWRVRLSGERIFDAASRGARVVLPALAILWLAGAMSRMTGNRDIDGVPSPAPYAFQEHRLYTGDFLKEQLLAAGEENTETFVIWLPTLVFLLSAVVSFCTGTSFGTMGILLPVVIPLTAVSIGVNAPGELAASPIFLCAMGSVLAGAIFGDHSSPISDTTILSSQASGCNHMAHVATQLPYALAVGAVATLLGTVLVGYGVSVWLLLPLQTAVLVGALLVMGRRVD